MKVIEKTTVLEGSDFKNNDEESIRMIAEAEKGEQKPKIWQA